MCKLVANTIMFVCILFILTDLTGLLIKLLPISVKIAKMRTNNVVVANNLHILTVCQRVGLVGNRWQ